MSHEQVFVLAQKFGAHTNEADLDNSSSFRLKNAMKTKAVEFYLNKKKELEVIERHLSQLGV